MQDHDCSRNPPKKNAHLFTLTIYYKGKVTGFSSSLDDFSVRHNPLVFPYVRFFFRGTSGAIVVLHSSLSLFVASKCLIRSGVGAIDSPDKSRQGFEQYDIFKVLEKVFQATF